MLTLLGAENDRSNPGTRIAPRGGFGELRASVRVVAVERGVQRVGANLAGDVELVGGSADPPAGGFTGAGVVVLDALADGLQVVVRLSLAELADGQHPAG
jgi:hypothetical protein